MDKVEDLGRFALFGGQKVRSEPYPIHTTNISDEEIDAVVSILKGGHLSGFSARPGERFGGGSAVKGFEEALSAKFEISRAVTFNSATSALHASLAAIGVGPGDEVITTPTTMSATASAIVMCNAIPVFADIGADDFCISPEIAESLVNERTKAIVVVNIFGRPAKLTKLREIADRHNIYLIEDNAQAPGIRTEEGHLCGTVGHLGILSFNYHKSIQTGEGGAVLCWDEELYEKLRLIRNHAEVVVGPAKVKDLINMIGWNYRMTEMQAALGMEQLKRLDFMNGKRQELAAELKQQLARIEFLETESTNAQFHGWYMFPMKFKEKLAGISRAQFAEIIRAEGVSISEGYVKPIYLEPMYQNRIAYGDQGCPFSCQYYGGVTKYDPGLCPVAEEFYFKTLLLTDICKFPNSEREVIEFSDAISKVQDNLSALKRKYTDGG